MKTCITRNEKDGQNVTRIPNHGKVLRIPRPTKREKDITNRQKSIKKGFDTVIQQNPGQRGKTIQNLSLHKELVRPEPAPQKEDQTASAAGHRGEENDIKKSMNANQKNHNH